MRAISILSLLLGAVACAPFFPSGREYEFNYQGRLMNGIPELDSHYAGLAIEGKVLLQALDQQTFKLALRNVKLSEFNKKLSGSREENWRMLRTPETEELSSEYQTILETPVEFNMVNGEIRNVKVSSEEPEWTLNFKKSLISLVKMQTSSDRSDIVSNQVRSQTGSLPEIWQVMEEGIDGECENTYEVSEVPEYMMETLTFGELESQKCEGRKVFQITKSRDVTKCTRRSSYMFAQPGKYECERGNCDSMWQRSSITRYIGCGQSAQQMELQVILNEGELQQNLMAYNTENTVTGVQQILKLVETRNSMSSLPEISSPRTIEDLFYEYPQVSEGPKSSSFLKQQQQLQSLSSSKKSFKPLIQDKILSKISPSTLKSKIVEKISEVVRDLKEVEHFEKKHVSSTVNGISKAMYLLSTEELKSLYSEVKGMNMDEEDRETARQLMLESVVLTGSNSAVLFLKEMILAEEFSPLRTGVVMATLPHYIQTPTIELLDELFELIKSPVVQKYETLKTNVELAFSTLVNKACLSNNEGRFPVYVYGEFCSSETSQLTTRYIPYLVEQLNSAESTKERQSAILNLGTIGHESVIPILLPYIEGRSERSTPVEQRMAIYSLSTVTRQNREILLPVYSALVHNPTENRNVRIAALSMMLYMEPSMVEFQKLATSTWFELDTEFHKFVFSTLKSLKEIEVSEMATYHNMFSLSNKAKVVYHLAKPVPGFISSTLNAFTSEWLKELEVGYHMHGSYSVLGDFKFAYGRLEYFFQKLEFAPIEFGFGMQGTEQLIEKISSIFGGDSQNPLSKIHPEWRKYISSLGLKSKDETPFNAEAWIRLFEDVQVATGLDIELLEPYMRAIKETRPQELKEKVCGKTPINFVKVNNWAPTEIIIPSDMGFPIFIEYDMPSVFSVRGDIHVDCSTTIPKVTFDVAKKASASSQGVVGTVGPMSKNMLAVGINEEWSINYPTKVSLEMEQGQLRITYTPNQYVNANSQEIDLWSYSIKPFSTNKPMIFEDMTPIIRSSETKMIESYSEKKQEVFSFGQSLGLDMKVEMETESDFRDLKSMMDHLSLYQYNPVNMVLFSWTNTAIKHNGKPSCRFHEVKVSYNPKKTTTDKIEIDLSMALGYQGKNKQVSAIQYRPSQSVSSSIMTAPIQSSNKHHQKVQQSIKSLSIEEGYGLSAEIEIRLEGEQSRTFNYQLTGSHGFSDVEQKWNMQLENESQMKICIKGESEMPLLPWRDLESVKYMSSRDTKFSYRNVIGFGQTCDEHRMEITGTTSTSTTQKEMSQSSSSSRKCEEATRRVQELREELKNTEEESTRYSELEEELVREVEKKNEYCRRSLKESSLLDEVEFQIKFTPLPQYLEKYAKAMETVVKGGLIPYMSQVESGNRKSNEVQVELKFNPRWNTVNMVLVTEEETIKYNNIRLPSQLENVIPLSTSERLTSQVSTAIKGSKMTNKCLISDSVVQTYDEKSYRYKLDDCYHVLSADCRKQHTHSVLGKVVDGKKYVKVYVQNSKVELEPASSYTPSRKEYEITVDGKTISLNKNQRETVQSENRQVTYKIERTSDDVIVLETPYNTVIYNGEEVEIEHRPSTESNECGLCGNKDGSKKSEFKTSSNCFAQSYKQSALSFRVQDSCSSLSSKMLQVKQQKEICLTKQQKKETKLPITTTIQSLTSKCQRTKHSLVRQGDRLCISQIPIVECGSSCTAKSLIPKSVPFTCLPAQRERVSKLYEEKVKRGEILPELRNMDKTFSAKMSVPVSCSHPGL